MWKRRTSPGRGWILSAAVVAGLFVVWYIIARIGLFSEYFVPSPLSVWQAFVETAVEGYGGHELHYHVGASLLRVLAGFAGACLTAIPLGLAMGCSRRVKSLFNPLIEFYRPLPPLAYYIILILWLGIGNASKVALLYLAAFPPLAINAMAGVRGVSQERIQTAMSLGANRWQVFRCVIFPSCLPDIFTGMRVSIGFTYTTLVSAEIVAATSGMGWMVWNAKNFTRSDIIFMANIVMGVTGLLLAGIIWLAELKIVPWKGKG